MATLTIRMTDEKANRLKAMASARKISLNKLMEELATNAITEFDVQTRYQIRAARGNAQDGLRTLTMLDGYYKDAPAAGASLHDKADGSFDSDMSVLKKQDDKDT